MQRKIKIINDLQKRINSLQPVRELDEEFKNKFVIDFTYHSNKIEGLKLTYGETINCLKHNIIPRNGSIKDILDIKNHKKIIESLFENLKYPLTPESIKQMHKELMCDIRQWGFEDDYSPGEYKWDTNYVILPDGKEKSFLSAHETPGAMEKLCSDITDMMKHADINDVKRHPLYISTYFHHSFVNIHPFADGNGRICRLTGNLILMKSGFTPFMVKNEQRAEYINTLVKADQENDITGMFEFFSKNLIESQEKKLNLFRDMSQSNDMGLH